MVEHPEVSRFRNRRSGDPQAVRIQRSYAAGFLRYFQHLDSILLLILK